MARLSVCLFGSFQVVLDGEPVRPESDKVRALLSYLVVEAGGPHRREKLAGLLWPDWLEQSARNNLRHTLAVLRKTIGDRQATPPVLEITRQTVQFNTESDAWADVRAFSQLLQSAEASGLEAIRRWEKAVDLYRGDFLQDFSLPDSPEFEAWALLSREQFRRQAMDGLHRLADVLEQRGEYERALKHAWRQTELDLWREEAHLQVMRLLALSGRRSEALAQYQTCLRLLAGELGVEPGAETTRLYEQIRDGQLGGGVPASRAPELDAGPPPFLEARQAEVERPVFVAREQELAQLNGYLDLALAGQGRVVFVTGEAGSGKTALMQAFARSAQAADEALVVAAGQSNAQTGIGDPYLPFREVLELLTGDVEARLAAGAMTQEHALRLWRLGPLAAQALVAAGQGLIDTFVPGAPLLRRAQAFSPGGADWLPQLAELTGRPPIPGRDNLSPQQSFFFEQYTSTLQTLARQAPLLILVDDLQWADLGSMSLLFHLGRELAGSRILILGAYRPEEVALGQQARSLDSGQAPSAGSAHWDRHPLEPVVQELQRLFGDITVDLGRAARRGFVEAYLESEPNRFGAGFQEMLYRQTGGHPLFTVELMRGLEEQAALVRDAEGYWVEGGSLDWQTLPARVEAVIAGRIDRLPRSYLAALRVASVEGEVFTAEVVAQVRGSNEQELLDSLSSELDRRHRLVRAQGIRRMGGQRLSQYRFRHTLFQKYLYNSLDEVERTYLHEEVGNTLEALHEGQPEAMAAVAGQLAWHFEQAGMVARAIPYLCQAGERALRLSAHQEAIALLARGLDHLAALDDSGGLAGREARLDRAQQELELQLALGRAQIVNIPESQWQKAYTRARELCQQMGKTSPLCPILGELSVFHYVRGEHLKAQELAAEALRQAEQDRNPLLVALGHWYLAITLFCQGRYAEAHTHFSHVISLYDPIRHHEAFVFHRGSDVGQAGLAYDACCLWCLGYPDQARQQGLEALALARQFDHPYSVADVLNAAGCMFNTLRRDPQALKSSAQELIRLSREKDFPGWESTAISFRGVAQVMLGRFEEGHADINRGMAMDRAMGVRINFAGYLNGLAQAQAGLGRLDEALATLDESLALMEETEERLWETDAHRLRAELLLMVDDEAGAEASFLKAIKVARSQNARSLELRAATGLARLWQKQGKGDEAREMLAGVYGWFSEGFDTPDLQEARALLEELSEASRF